METSLRGFKLNTVIDRFAWDLLLILRETFTADTFDSEHLKLRILMTLSDVIEKRASINPSFPAQIAQKKYRSNYVKGLLFRDFSASKASVWHTFNLPASDSTPAQTIRIHDESITYLSSVLERRLTLAQNLKDKPTNLHVLFSRFSTYSTLHTKWQSAQAVRALDCFPTETEKDYFSACAQTLAEQISQLADDYSDISHRRRDQYGPLWLIVGECKAELAEELSLFDAFNAFPLALDNTFFNDPLLQKSLIRVLGSLNERYKLLRSAGLSPQIWLERAEPSIATLRDLKQLRRQSDELLKTGQVNTVITGFRMAFNEKKATEQRKKIAGCKSFDEFSQTEFGQSMLKYSALSLDQSSTMSSDEEQYLYDAIPGSNFEEEQIQTIFNRLGDDFDWVQYLMDCRPELFDEVSTFFFQQAIALDCPLEGAPDDQPLLKNPQFLNLINSHPQYKHLTQQELSEQLIQQAENIIEQGIRLSSQPA